MNKAVVESVMSIKVSETHADVQMWVCMMQSKREGKERRDLINRVGTQRALIYRNNGRGRFHYLWKQWISLMQRAPKPKIISFVWVSLESFHMLLWYKCCFRVFYLWCGVKILTFCCINMARFEWTLLNISAKKKYELLIAPIQRQRYQYQPWKFLNLHKSTLFLCVGSYNANSQLTPEINKYIPYMWFIL